ncbi:MAG: DUF1501 domain-containing protein [Fimbriimonadaceae bacterium]|nr:DUF1501 domain-containing protein [Fimbriimonadaceae bacterium]
MNPLDKVKTRREFLQRGLTLAAAAATVPTFVDRTALAADNPATTPAGRPQAQPILVIVQLAGGNDGLNTLVPYTDEAYHRARPTLGLKAEQVLKIDDQWGLHPQLPALKGLYDQGLLGIVRGVGYPNPDRSHFRSMEIWETAADSNQYLRHGWVGRYFDNHCVGAAEGSLVGLAVGRQAPQAFGNSHSLGVSLQRPDTYRWRPSARDYVRQVELFKALAEPTTGANPTLDFLQRTALNANVSSAQVIDLALKYRSSVSYPDTEFAQDLKVIAQMIAGNLGSRVYYASHGGFDTHAQQAKQHGDLLETFATGLEAFLKDLAAQGNRERVLVIAFSEFGRRVAENGSDGTDHGAAGLLFTAGGPARPGLHGGAPSLTDLERGDLKHTVDFRSVYATALQQWLRCDPLPVLGKAFPTLDLLRV